MLVSVDITQSSEDHKYLYNQVINYCRISPGLEPEENNISYYTLMMRDIKIKSYKFVRHIKKKE